MAFFLIGRGPEDDLHLLSEKPLPSRQEAMAELSRLSGDPSFGRWDSEVFVMDIDQGIPVLLVRPAGTSDAAVVTRVTGDSETEVGADAEAWLADVAEATVSDEDLEPTVELVGDEAIADEIAEEAEEDEELVAQVAVSDEAAETTVPAASGEEDLRSALERTAEHMSATGIVLPESIGGPAEEEARAEAGQAHETAVAEAPALEPESTEIEPELIEAEVSAESAEPRPESTAPAAPSAAGETAAWPWDVAAEEPLPTPAVAPDLAFVYNALEEPGHQDAGTLSVAPEAVEEAPRPVILGAYGEPGESSVEATPDASQEAHEPMGSDEVPAPPAEEVTSEEPSDFIVDMEEIAPEAGETGEAAEAPDAEPVSTQPGFTASASGDDGELRQYTCDDCVYVETCPNKDQRLPKDCGSFQWK